MNKNGWGLRVELAFILLFLVCLLIATIGLSKFGLIGGEKEAHEIHGDMINDSFNYSSLENKLTVSANKYYNEKYLEGISDTIVISSDVLMANGYLSDLKDGNGKDCSGYSKVHSNGVIVSYVKCNKYTTTGYEIENE